MEHLDKVGIVVIHNIAVPHIQGIDFFHLFPRQRKVPDVKIMLHAFFMYRLGDDHHAPLNVPPQGHLGSGFPMGLTNFRQNGIGEHTELSYGKGSPGFWNHAVIPHNLDGFFLMEEGVNLDLIYRRLYRYGLAKVQQTGGWKLQTPMACSVPV